MHDIIISISFPITITGIKKDGFVGTLKTNAKGVIIKDRLALCVMPYIEGQEVIVKITTITPSMIEEEIAGKKFYCVVYELSNNGFYTKDYREEKDRLKRVFWYEARGMITIPDEQMDRYEVGDLLKVEII